MRKYWIGLALIGLTLAGLSAAYYARAAVNLTGTGSGHRMPIANSNGLQGWWKFDKNATDSSGNQYDGISSNGPSNSTGVFGNSFTFNGTNSYVSVVDASGLDPSSITLAAWVSFFALPTSGNTAGIMSKRTSAGSNEEYNLLLNNTSGTYTFQMRIENQTSAGQYATYTFTPSLNTWYFVVGTYNGTTIQLYLDGVAQGSTGSPPAGITSAASKLYFGTLDNTTGFMSGSIDDARIYNRAISQAEITQLYQGSQPVNCDQTCVGWWKLDDAAIGSSSTSAADSSNNSNTGTLTNFAFTAGTDGWATGVFGNAVQFNSSTSDYIDTGAGSSTNFTGTQSFSISAWIKTGSSSTEIIFSKYNSGVGGNYYFGLSGAKLLAARNGGGSISGTTNLNTNAWTFVTFTYDGSNLRVYVNGVSDATAVANSSSVSGSATTHALIGAYYSSSSPASFFSGLLDDVRVYNRALASYEIYDMYLAGRS